MDLKTMQEFLTLQRQAEAEGKPMSQVLEAKIKQEETRLGEASVANVRVQIMPHNAVAGHGRWPAIVMMNKEKAVDLAMMGIVKIIESDEDIVKEDDRAAIEEHVDEMMAIRKSHDAKTSTKQKIARLTNVVSFLERQEKIEKEKQESLIPKSINEIPGEKSLKMAKG